MEAVLDVVLSVDVEVWCNGWCDLDDRFAKAYRQYVYGHTAKGDFGLPFQACMFRQHGLTGTFFVEPFFSTRFGTGYLQEIVGILRKQVQEVELHLHTEWVNEVPESMPVKLTNKRQHIRQFSLDEQTRLIGFGRELLQTAGAGQVNAFRAGSFAFNRDTLRALAANGMRYDSSYNACMFAGESGVRPGQLMNEPFEQDAVVVYPMTVFRDAFGKLRHLQLSACSIREMEWMLWRALEKKAQNLVILLHNFELLSRDKARLDRMMLRRFDWLCNFLARHAKHFRTTGFTSSRHSPGVSNFHIPRMPLLPSLQRGVEQMYRRKYS